MDRGAWWATVHGITKSWTRLNGYHIHFGLYLLNANSTSLGCDNRKCPQTLPSVPLGVKLPLDKNRCLGASLVAQMVKNHCS